MAMAIKLSTVINTYAFFCQLFFVYNNRRMTIAFYSLDATGMNMFMGLDQGVNSCLSLYKNIHVAVLSSLFSLEVGYFCLILFIKEAFLICCPVFMEQGWRQGLEGVALL